MEFKSIDNKSDEDTRNAAAEEALQQIEQQNYKQELIEQGVKHILSLGVTFAGKEVAMRASVEGSET